MAAKKRAGSGPVDRNLIPELVRPPETPREEGEEEPQDQFCYLFNDALPPVSDDRKCRNCKKFLTTLCDQIEHFIDEDGDVDG
jgi:hypothetical protein